MYKVVTAPTTEPITLTQVKMQLRLASSDFADDLTSVQSIAPGAHPISSINGTGVEVLGYDALVNLNAGTAAGTLDVHIEESDDNVTFADWTGGTFTQVTAANDNAIYEKAYTGTKRYIRAVAVIAAGACDFSAVVIKNTMTNPEDDLLTQFITAAREFGEGVTEKAFATQTLEMLLDDFSKEDFIELEMAPLQSVTSIKYKDSASVETTMTATTQYIVDADRDIGRIVLPYGITWPSFVPYTVNPIKIRYITGYTTLPESFKHALLMHVGFMYKNRDTAIPDADLETVMKIYNRRKASWF